MNPHTLRPKTPSQSRFFRAGLLLALPALGSLASAEDNAPTPVTAIQREDVVEMSAFRVSTDKDVGYRASNSISGTRSNTPIKDVPLNIQVFTEDFTDDINATSQLDVERYNASLINGGADVHSDNPIQQTYNSFLFRGFIQNWGLRDGVRTYDPIDTVGLARIEIVKGPAAALYGVTYAGGVMNSISREVEFSRNFSSLSFSAQNEGGYRATIDSNYTGKAGPGAFGVRVSAAYAKTKDYRAHSEGNVKFTQINLNWRPIPSTEFKFLAESGSREKPTGLGYFTAPERVGGVDLANGSAVPLQITHPEIPWTWNWATGNVRTSEISLQRGTITHTVNENLSFTGYYTSSHRLNVDSDGWDNSSGGGGSAASWDVGPSWRPYATYLSGWLNPNTPSETITMGYHHRDWENVNHAYGATALYKFDLGSVRNTVTVGGNAWREKFLTRMSTLPTGTTSLISFPVRANINLATPPPPSDFFTDASGGYGHETNTNKYYFANWQVFAFDNRVKVNAGYTRTSLNLKNWASGTTVVPAVTELSKNSPMVGAMFDITREISLFAVHSTSLFPTTDKNDFNVTLPPTVGKSIEGGVKIELLDGKISGTISYYQITQTGGSQRDAAAINQNKVAWDSMTSAQRAISFPGLTRDQLTDRSGQPGDLVAGAESESKGYEADLILQPLKQYQILFSYAHNTVGISKALNPANVGQTTAGSIKDQLAMMHKYTFVEGGARGLSLGLGFHYAGKAFQDYSGPGGTARYNPKTLYAEAFASYRFRIGSYQQRLQLNVKNLTRQEDFVGWKATGSATTIATERYQVPTKMAFTLTYGLDF